MELYLKMQVKRKLLLLIVQDVNLVNAIENKYCSKCSYPLKPEAYDEIKKSENEKIIELEEKIKDINEKFNQIITMIQKVPVLNYIKPEILTQKIIEK